MICPPPSAAAPAPRLSTLARSLLIRDHCTDVVTHWVVLTGWGDINRIFSIARIIQVSVCKIVCSTRFHGQRAKHALSVK